AQVVQRMDLTGHDLGQRAHAGAVARRGRKQGRLRPHLVEVFEDGQRLAQVAVAVLQHRHQLLRIEPGEVRRVLLTAAAHQVHRGDVVLQALEVEPDAHAIGGAGTPVRVQAQGAVAVAVAAFTAAPRRFTFGRHVPSPFRCCAGAGPPRPRPASAQGAPWCSMSWSMAPKIDAPSSSSISMRTRSPKDMNGVFGAPCSNASTVRLSAKQDAPSEVSLLAIVPEPTRVPAESGRVLAAWAT